MSAAGMAGTENPDRRSKKLLQLYKILEKTFFAR
jgi:hypothetical protein